MLVLSGCSVSDEQLKKAVEKNPDIVFGAIEKNPEKFIEVVNKAAREAQMKAQEKATADESKLREAEFANPKKPKIDESRPMKGPKDAVVTIVEYSDFECPYCEKGYRTIQQVLKEYPTQVRVLFKHLPLEFHPKAMPAAIFFQAIAKQSAEKAFKFHDTVFENQNELRAKGDAFMKETAKKIGVDMAKLEKDLKSEDIKKQIAEDMEEAKGFDFSGTPGFLINGVSLKGAYPFPEFKTIIDKFIAAKK